MTLTSGFDVSKRWVFPGASLAPCQQDREMLQKQDSTQSWKSAMPLQDLKIMVKLNFFQDSISPHKKAHISFCPLQKLCWYFLPFAEIALIVSVLCKNCVDSFCKHCTSWRSIQQRLHLLHLQNAPRKWHFLELGSMLQFRLWRMKRYDQLCCCCCCWDYF